MALTLAGTCPPSQTTCSRVSNCEGAHNPTPPLSHCPPGLSP